MEAYRPEGTCARQIIFSVNEDGVLTDLKFLGGCLGCLQAIVRFTVGHKISEIISMCDGIKCKNNTSCPEQLAVALRRYQKMKEAEKLDTASETKHRGHPRILETH